LGGTSCRVEVLTPEEEAQKSEVMKVTQKVCQCFTDAFLRALTSCQQIKSWFNHHCNAIGLKANPWIAFLKELRRPLEVTAPKCISDHQYYMQHPSFSNKVQATYQAIHEKTPIPKNERLNIDLLKLETKEVQAHIHAEATREHRTLLEAYNGVEEGLPSADESDRAL
jgi:hypothetical protein